MLKISDRFDRVELPVVTAEAPPAAEQAKKAKRVLRKPKATEKPAAAQEASAVAYAKPWACFGVLFTLALSAGLNGYANSLHAPAAWAGWLMGLAVPVLVLTLSKVAGEKYRSCQKPVAWLAGGSGVALLFLSVWHCANSIALLTGSGLLLAVPMAVSIDCGLVACEIALITEPRE
jgi:hypothetical protein